MEFKLYFRAIFFQYNNNNREGEGAHRRLRLAIDTWKDGGKGTGKKKNPNTKIPDGRNL